MQIYPNLSPHPKPRKEELILVGFRICNPFIIRCYKSVFTGGVKMLCLWVQRIGQLLAQIKGGRISSLAVFPSENLEE